MGCLISVMTLMALDVSVDHKHRDLRSAKSASLTMIWRKLYSCQPRKHCFYLDMYFLGFHFSRFSTGNDKKDENIRPQCRDKLRKNLISESPRFTLAARQDIARGQTRLSLSIISQEHLMCRVYPVKLHLSSMKLRILQNT